MTRRSLVAAATLVGDRRHQSQLLAFSELVPSEHISGGTRLGSSRQVTK
jgi:hypothetical protein